MTEDKILNWAIQKFGHRQQTDVMIEEMAELTQALIKHRRYPDDKDIVEHIREEMADVEIMLRQMEIIYGEAKYWKDAKLKRLALRLAMQEESNDSRR